MLNCTRVLDIIAMIFDISCPKRWIVQVTSAPGANGLVLLPYLAGERTPNLPAATGSLFGFTDEVASPDNMLRAAVDGVAAGIAYCIEALRRLGVDAPVITLVGGGSRTRPGSTRSPTRPGGPSPCGRSEHGARGAAIQVAAIGRGETVAALGAMAPGDRRRNRTTSGPSGRHYPARTPGPLPDRNHENQQAESLKFN